MIGFGYAVLRLPPDAFWAMTPREIAAALGAVAGRTPDPMDRGALEALIRSFPDR